ncbi:MAG: SAM-dependent methyltransferase [Betaproteobacteria bacterium]|nr:SAM-dependent methyltransferase [Betaproteobacteria bacterium]MDE2423655.1 SAM-dependent methyltransferase [Betaproteobacteria bacterium]
MNINENDPTLFLIPVPIYEDTQMLTLPSATLDVIKKLDFFVVENAKVARKHLKNAQLNQPIADLSIKELDQNLSDKALEELLNPITNGHSIGLMSDAGCPAIADPGARLVRLAHQKRIHVVPLVGPSSILLALMASGLNGQCFCFHGYLPVKEDERNQKIKAAELRSKHNNETQILIETPYRNQVIFNALLTHLTPNTLLTVAFAINSPNEVIQTKAVHHWRERPLSLEKAPAIYLFLAQ